MLQQSFEKENLFEQEKYMADIVDQWFSTFFVPRPIIATRYNPMNHI